MLLGIVGCNMAWGLIDCAMDLMSSMFDRGRKARRFESVQKTASEEEALSMVGRELDPGLEPFTSLEERTRLYSAVLKRLEKVGVTTRS
jgi:hypothetical protein